MGKLIGYARVSTKVQDTDRQEQDLLAAGVRRDDLYIDHGVSGAKASRPEFDRARAALHPGDTLVVTTLDRLGRSTQNMLDLAKDFREGGVGLRVLNLGGGDVDTSTPMGEMVFTVMSALAQMERAIKQERSVDSINKRRAAGKDLGGRRQRVTDSQVQHAKNLIDGGASPSEVARDFGMSRATLYRRIGKLEPKGGDRVSLTVITVTELSRHTSAIVQRCEEGEVFLITRRGVPAVIMRPLTDEERAASNSTERVEIDSDLLSQARAVLDPDGELSDSEVVHLALRTGIRTQQRACERAE